MNKYFKKIFLISIFGLALVASCAPGAYAIAASATGNWNATTTWTPAQVPVSGDAVTIGTQWTVTVTAPATCDSITTTAPGGGQVNGVVIGAQTLTVNGNLSLTSGAGTKVSSVTISTGTLNVGGNILFGGTPANSIISFSGAGTLNVGGAAGIGAGGTLTTVAGSTVDFNGAGAQTGMGYTFVNLTLSGSGAKTVTGATVSGILSMKGSATTAGTAITYSGGAQTLVYQGSVAQITSALEFPASWIGSGGVKVENANGVSLDAVRNINANPLTIGATISNSIFNDNGFQLTATGTLNLTSGTFKLGAGTATNWPGFGTNTISSGTTVEYAAGVAQTVSSAPVYQDLTFSGASTKTTAAGTINIIRNWNVTTGTATLGANNTTVTVTGDVTGSGNITSGSGTISLRGAWTNNGTFTPATGTVNYNNPTGGQTIGGLTYNNLTLSNTSGTDTASSGNVTVNGTLTTTTGGTLNLSTFQLLGTLTPTNGGILRTQNTSATPIPNALAWGGTVQYDATTGGQTVRTETSYNNLTLGNTSGTSTADGTITANGTLTTTAGGTMNMSTFALAGGASFAITNGGTLRTQNNTTTPLPPSKAWGGTVNYDLSTGSQTITTETSYNNLTLGNTSGTDSSNANLTVNGTLLSTAGGTLDLSTNQLLGTLSTITNGGTIRTQNTSTTPIPYGKTWTGTGTVEYYAGSGQTVATGEYNDLTFSGAGAKTTTTGTVTVDGSWSVTNGTATLSTNNTNITIKNNINGTGAITAGSGAILLAGNWANTGTFTAGSSTVTLNGTTQETITPQLSFYNLTLTNSSGVNSPFFPGIIFASGETISNNYTITTGSVRVQYQSGQTYTCNNINWNGQASGTKLFFRNSNSGAGTWLLKVSGTQTAVSYVDVARSDASGGNTIVASNSTDSLNNTKWSFGAATNSTFFLVF